MAIQKGMFSNTYLSFKIDFYAKSICEPLNKNRSVESTTDQSKINIKKTLKTQLSTTIIIKQVWIREESYKIL